MLQMKRPILLCHSVTFICHKCSQIDSIDYTYTFGSYLMGPVQHWREIRTVKGILSLFPNPSSWFWKYTFANVTDLYIFTDNEICLIPSFIIMLEEDGSVSFVNICQEAWFIPSSSPYTHPPLSTSVHNRCNTSGPFYECFLSLAFKILSNSWFNWVVLL